MNGFTPVVLDSADQVGRLAAELVRNRLVAQHHLTALLPTGATPLPMYEHLRRLYAAQGLPASAFRVLQLDEYVGLERDDPRSYRAYMHRELGFIEPARRDGPDVWCGDLQHAAARYEQLICDLGGVDLAVVGIGRNGHVAFNEPPADLHSTTGVVALADSTRTDAAQAFGGVDHVPTHAVSVGMATIMAAREVLMLACGERKAEAVRRMLREPAGPDSPASLLQIHRRLTVICDRPAAALL